jgi:hypothetical protein
VNQLAMGLFYKRMKIGVGGIRNMRLRNKILNILVAIFITLSFLATDLGPFAANNLKIAQAASVPAPSELEATLYVGYHDYKIEIDNLSAKANVTYSSSNKAVVTVTKRGVIKPLATGKTTITVKISQNAKKYSYKIKVIVEKPHIDINWTNNIIYVGDSYILDVNVYGIDNASFIYSSSNEKVGIVHEYYGSDTFTALSPGTTVITVKDEVTGIKEDITITVTSTQNPTTPYTPPKGSDKAAYLSGLDLSKQTGTYFTTTKEEYIQTTRFNLYLDKGVQVPVNAIDLINYIMDTIEDTVDYQFYVQHYNNTKFYNGMDYELIKYF